MPYTECELEEAVLSQVSKGQLEALGLPRAIEEAALVIFIGQYHVDFSRETEVLREALINLREQGALKYTKHTI